jgi:RNA polymerase sigma factor (sigma-70 family)
MTGGQPSIDGQWIRTAVARYEQPLIAYATHIVGNPEIARDVVQDTFVRLCTRDRAELEGHLAEWLYTVCRNRALDVRRKDKRMRPLVDEHTAMLRTALPGPAETSENRDAAANILRLVQFLPENQREVIRLKFQHNLSYQQIGRITNLSATNVGFLISTGLKRVREQLASDARRSL